MKKVEYGYAKRAIAAILGSCILLTLSGCKKKDVKPRASKECVMVEDNYPYGDYGKYEYVLDYSFVENTEISKKCINWGITKELYKTIDEKQYNDVRNFSYSFVLPSSFNHYLKYYDLLNEKISKQKVVVKRIKGVESNFEITIIQTKIIFCKDLPVVAGENFANDELIRKNDEINATSMYYNGNLIAFNQTGVGCESINVPSVGNVNGAVKNVSDLNVGGKVVNYRNIDNFEYSLNGKSLVRTRF